MIYKDGNKIEKGLFGWISKIRRRLYRNITPFGYHNPVSRTVGAIALNQRDDTRTAENKRIKDSDPDASALDALWATYLNIPENQRRNINPKYGISKTKDGYYRFNNPGIIFNFEQDLSPQGLFGLPGRKSVMMSSILGNYATGLRRDTKGDYIFYSDSRLNPDGTPDIKTGWDINPYSNTVDNDTEETTEEYGQYGQDKKDLSYKVGKALLGNVEDISMGIGTPVPIYDKIYLDDIYNVKGKDRGGHYLPEITVTGKKKLGGKMNAIEQFKQGSKIHIKKKNRGKFTAYCGGNVTSACIAKAKASGNPTLVKRATFAANARKWKHLNGGIIKAETGLSTSSFIDPMIVDYIKAIENPNRVGWNGKIWKAPGLKGYDLNLRGYGIDINTNNAARKLTAGRQGQWLTDDEANTLMLDHIRYIMNAANKHIKGFGELPIGRKAALLGMLYRGDSVNKSNINIAEPDDTKFFNSVHNYYISKGLKERAANSSKFFKSHENSNTLNFNFNNYKDLNYPFKYIQ